MGVGQATRAWNTTSGNILKTKDTPAAINCQKSSGKGWNMKSTSTIYSRILDGLILCRRSCTGSYSCCEFLNMIDMPCPGASFSQHSSPLILPKASKEWYLFAFNNWMSLFLSIPMRSFLDSTSSCLVFYNVLGTIFIYCKITRHIYSHIYKTGILYARKNRFLPRRIVWIIFIVLCASCLYISQKNMFL